jgi:hypothetical protein
MIKLFIGLLVFPALAFMQLADPVTVKDLKPAFGQWKGSLTYLDYSSGKPYSMPANVTISKDKKNDHQLILAFQYPDEPKANEIDTLILSNDGLQINGAMVISKEKTGNGLLQIITEKPGVDGNDNRKAVVKHIYTISKKVLVIRKEIRFEGEEKFIMRNEYKMNR